VGIGLVLVRPQHLDFVSRHQFHAAIADACRSLGNLPLDVELAIPEVPFGDQAAGARHDPEAPAALSRRCGPAAAEVRLTTKS
jgi:hypothetical protein